MDQQHFECEYGACGRGKESVLVQHGECTALAILNGPFEPAGPIIDLFKGTVRVLLHSAAERRSELQMYQVYMEKMFSSVIILGKYPRAVLEIKVYLLSYKDNYLAAIINAISTLLLGAGILLNGVALGVYVSNADKAYTVGVMLADRAAEVIFHVGDKEESEWRKNINDLEERLKYTLKACYKEECKDSEFFLGSS